MAQAPREAREGQTQGKSLPRTGREESEPQGGLRPVHCDSKSLSPLTSGPSALPQSALGSWCPRPLCFKEHSKPSGLKSACLFP